MLVKTVFRIDVKVSHEKNGLEHIQNVPKNFGQLVFNTPFS